MSNDRKPWVRRNPKGDGFITYWNTPEGVRKQKRFPNRGQADRYAAEKLKDLRSELREPDEVIPISWTDMLERYRTYMRYEQCEESAIKRRFLTINTFAEEMKITKPSHVTPANLEKYIGEVLPNRITRFERPTAPATVYHDKGHLKAFIRWAIEQRYIAGKFRLKMGKAPQWRAPKSLPVEDVAKLMALFNDDAVVEFPDAWRTRLILAICTGQRRSIIEALTPAKFSVTSENGEERGFLEVIDAKTHKPNWEPINSKLWPYVSAYVKSRLSRPRFWPDRFESKKWERICNAMGWPSPGFQFHDLRKVFASAMQEAGAPTGVTQKMLNHSTPNMTNDVYTHFDPALKVFVERLPGDKWMKDVAIPTSEEIDRRSKKKKKAWRPRRLSTVQKAK